MTKQRDRNARGQGRGRDPRRAPPAAERRPARDRDRPPEAPEPAPLESVAATRALSALTVTLAALTAARAACSFIPGMWLWSLNLQRFLPPGVAWITWIAVALAFVPPLARRIEPLLARAGDATITRRPARVLWAAAAALLAWLLPDRIQFVGDFLLRQSTLQTQGQLPALWYPQAMPLDLLIHDTLGRVLLALSGMRADTVGRLLGALEAAALALLAIQYARELRLRGTAACAAAAVVFFGGYLTLFTGYNKCFTEMTLVVAAAGLLMVRLARGRGSLMPLGMTLAAGALIHRSTLALYPAALLALWSWSRSRPRGAWLKPASLIALALPIAAQVIVLPRMLAVMGDIDARHFAPPKLAAQGWLAATVGPVRLSDMLNLVLMLSPAYLGAAVLMLASRRKWGWRAEYRVLALLALSLLVMMVFVHPQQGMFRDWDVFATVGAGLSLLAAFAIGESLRSASARSFVAVPVVATVALFTLQWLIHEADLDRGLERVHAFMAEPPARTVSQQTTTWEYLGIRNNRAGRWEAAAAAYREAAARLPSPNILRQLGFAEERAGQLEGARDVYRLMLSRNPADGLAQSRLALVMARMDSLAADSAARAQPRLPHP